MPIEPNTRNGNDTKEKKDPDQGLIFISYPATTQSTGAMDETVRKP